MSLTTVVPVIDHALEHKDMHIQTGSSVTFREFISTNYSNNQASFSCPPPSLSTYIDRCVMVSVPLTVTYAGTTTGSSLLQDGYDALRCLPIASIVGNAQLTINNEAFSMQVSDIVPALSHFWKESENNSYPDVRDKYMNYVDGVNAISNPLASYASALQNFVPRGAFPATITNGATSATLSTTIIEPLWLPVLHKKLDESLGFTQVQTFDVVLNFIPNLNRVVSHAASLATFSSVTVSIGQPSILFKYTTPPITDVPRPIMYECDNVERFVTSIGGSFAPNASSEVVSSNMQFGCVPRYMIIYIGKNNGNKTYEDSDTALRINSISVNFANQAGLLSSANSLSLYQLSRDNMLQDTWEEFNGVTQVLATPKGLVGSFLKINFGKDLSLPSDVWVGKNGSYNLSFKVNFTNVNPSVTHSNLALTTIVCTPEKLEIKPGGLCQRHRGFTDPPSGEYIPYSAVRKYYGGGGFMSFMSKVGKFIQPLLKPLHNFIKDNKFVSKGLSALSVIPQIAVPAMAASQVANQLGYGVRSRAELKQRLRRV